MSDLARQWAQRKTAGWAVGAPVSPWGQAEQNEEAKHLLRSHFPYREGRESILEANNISTMDKATLLGALNSAATTGSSSRSGAVGFKQFLPALAGAGLGYLGAAMVAPVFGLTDQTKNRMGIGAAAIGAVLNSLPVLPGLRARGF